MTQNTPTPKNSPALVLVILLVVAIVGVLFFLLFQRITQPTPTELVAIVLDGQTFDGSKAIDPPRPIADFTLTNQQGQAFGLADLRGKYALISFGFTHCPDVCPLTLNEFKQIRQELGDLSENIHFVFISVDGQRDTPQALASYFRVRGIDTFIGLSGTAQALAPVVADFGVFYELGTPDESGNYNVDHTAGSFLLDPQGRWTMRYAYGTPREVIVEDLRAFLGGA